MATTKPTPDPLSARASGLWFRTPAGVAQRYEPAPGDDDTHWYLEPRRGIWRVFSTDQVKPIKKKGSSS